MGQRRGEKKKHLGQGGCYPQNGLNRLILNWCIGGCWFTPTVEFGYIALKTTLFMCK